MTKSTHQKSVAVIAYYIKDSSPFYLLLRYAVYNQKHWDFLKGKIDKNERLVDTAKREALEEANIKNIVLKNNFSEESTYSFVKDTGEKVNKTVTYLLSEISEKNVSSIKISSEHDSFTLVRYDDALKLLKSKNQKDILKKANSFIMKNFLKILF